MTPTPPQDLTADAPVRELPPRGSHLHLLGIGGIGMAGLAELLRARGWRVSGCDLARGGPAEWLAARGLAVAAGHDPAHLDAGVDAVIRSTAVPEDHPELQAARGRGLPIRRRGEVLAALMATYPCAVAVSGTHGKTTTTGFITQLLRHAGRAPAWCIGGELVALDGVAGAGDGACLVAEADESDGTLVFYRPDVAVVTNIEFDHMEHFADVAAFEAVFRRFLDQARRAVVVGIDDPRAAALLPARPAGGVWTFGFSAAADVRGGPPAPDGEGQRLDVWVRGQRVGEMRLAMAGSHHARNALAAVAVGLALEVPVDILLAGAAGLRLARRRFETLSAGAGVRVISDYAHHPTEVAAVVATAKRLPHRRLVVVFQPHRYTRTRALGADFPAAFAGVDRLLLTPVYAASETPLAGGTVWDLYAHFREAGSAAATATAADALPVPRVADTLAEAWGALRRELRPGDLLLVLGAGDVEAIAHWAAAALAAPAVCLPLDPGPDTAGLALSPGCVVRRDEPLAAHTSLGVGGAADLWLELDTEADLCTLLRWRAARGLAVTLFGGGYNTLASDLGLRGVAVRLAGPVFHRIREADGLIMAGAAVTLDALLDAAQARGYGGFEFLEGIPGTLGGGMQMNAGAWGECLGDHLEWIRCLNPDGEVAIVPADGLDLGYRRCTFLRERVLIEAAFRVRAGDPEAMKARRLEIRARRAWMAGYRSAGSYFKNPDGDKAGRLLEAVGMHGARVGGAWIGTHHANFVIVDAAATASDVRALTERGRAAVRARFGIELEPEVKWCG